MSPDIEWRVGEGAEQETIAQTASTRRSRRKLWTVIGAIGLGVVLGMIYRSIPEPLAQLIDPAPIPTAVQTPLPPRPTLESLEAALQRDAFHLAMSAGESNDRVTFDPALARMPQAYADWYAALQNAYGSWGTASSSVTYTIHASGTLPNGTLWFDLSQPRHGTAFRQTRFYQARHDRWVWVLPDPSFWNSGYEDGSAGSAGDIRPLIISAPTEDRETSLEVFSRFTRIYAHLCADLHCPLNPAAPPKWSTGISLTLQIVPKMQQPVVNDERGHLTVYLPSARVTGYYTSDNVLGDPIDTMAYDILIDPLVRAASGNYARWETDRGGELFLQAIVAWKRARVREEVHPLELFYPPASLPPASLQSTDKQPVSPREIYVSTLHNESLLPLISLWDWPTEGRGFGLLQHVAVDEAEAVIVFIEDQYGPDGVVNFLNGLGQAHSLEEAIETALPIGYAEFNRQWGQWISGG